MVKKFDELAEDGVYNPQSKHINAKKNMRKINFNVSSQTSGRYLRILLKSIAHIRTSVGTVLKNSGHEKFKWPRRLLLKVALRQT